MAIDYDLANKYRPTTFESLVGNTACKEAIQSVLTRSTGVPHAWLLHGPSGCGKTTLARIIAKHLKCHPQDYHEYDLGSDGGVDVVRTILDQTGYAPKWGDVKVYVLDECHELTTRAQNALLKNLEEPPKHVYFILCTTDPQKLITTVRSRCQAATFEVERLRKNDCYKLLDSICEKEGVDPLSQPVKEAIYTCSSGCRDILGYLDKVIDIEDDEQALQLVTKQSACETQIADLCTCMVGKPTVKKVVPILKALRDQKEDPEKIRRAILAWLTNSALRNQNAERCAIVIQLFSSPYYDVGFAGLVRDCIDSCSS